MKDVTVKTHASTATPLEGNPEVDEQVWQAWIQRNRERDRMRFNRRLRIAKYLFIFLAIGSLIWKYTH